MRQSEVARLAGLVVALLLVVPLAQTGRTLVASGAFLVEFLTQGRCPALSWLTSPPARERLTGVDADRYVPETLGRGRPLVLVHGYAPEGKDDPRVREAAGLLARAGFDVAVPTIPGLTRGRLRAEDVEVVVATLAARPGPVVVLGVSVGAGPALLATVDPRVRARVRAAVSLGGYASALEVLRFWLTGTFAYGDVHGRVPHDPQIVRALVRANADLLGPAELEALESGDPGGVERFFTTLPDERRRYLDTLSPLLVARDIPGRLILVHGYQDQAVPYTESLRMAAARPRATTLVLVGVVDHVEGGATLRWRDARDFLALWRVVYGLLGGA